MTEKRIYTLITPEGKELIIGDFTTEGKARGAARRRFASDWLSLCVYPIAQRPVRTGENVFPWLLWEGK